MFHAKENQQMAPEQYGNCKAKSAGIHSLNKRLLYNYAPHYTHKLLVVCSNDAKGCYDCVVFLVVALCLCCLGAPKMAVQSMVSTIQGMQHHVCSTYANRFNLKGGHNGQLQFQALANAMEHALTYGQQ